MPPNDNLIPKKITKTFVVVNDWKKYITHFSLLIHFFSLTNLHIQIWHIFFKFQMRKYGQVGSLPTESEAQNR